MNKDDFLILHRETGRWCGLVGEYWQKAREPQQNS